VATEDLKIRILAKDQTKRAFSSTKKGLDGVKKAVFSLKSAFIGLGAASVLKSVITTASEVENLKVRLKFLTGSVEDAGKAFDVMNKFAKRVPFSLEDIERASAPLLTVADNVNDLNELLEITGDIAAVSGLSFSETAMQLQRAMGAGIASADQFREKGISAFLGFQSGVSYSAEETTKIIKNMWREGTTTAKGATKDLANTFTGQVSMMEDAWRELKITVAEAGIFEEVAKAVTSITEMLKDPSTKQGVKDFGEGLTSAFKFIVDNKEILLQIATAYAGGKIGKTIAGAPGGFLGAGLALGATQPKTEGVMGTFGVPAIKPIDSGENRFLGVQFTQEELNEEIALLDARNKAFEDHLASIPKPEDVILPTQETPVLVDLVAQEELMAQARAISYQYLQELLGEEIMTEEEAWDSSYARQLEALKAFNDKKLISDQQYAIAKGNIEKKVKEETIQTALDGFNALAQHNEKLFKIMKAVNIVNAIMDTYAGANKALAAYPPPWNYIAAAGVVAAGLANVATIKSQQFTPQRRFGGSVRAGEAVTVGEQGKETFIPQSNGTIVAGAGTAPNINFTIIANDTAGFDDLLQSRRGHIIGMINQALNDQGRPALA